MDPSDRARRLRDLSPAQRRLLEQRLRGKRGAVAGTRPESIPPAGPGPAPLSFSQERFWLLEQIDPGNPAHHVPTLSRLLGHLNPEALAEAFAALVGRHEILRTTFRLDGGRPVQCVAPAGPTARWELLDLRSLPPARRQAERDQLLERLLRAPFDLERGPLLRMALLRHGEHDHELVACFHHIVADGLSTQLMADELVALYGAAVQGRPAPLAPLPLQYRDHAAWQRATLDGEALEQGLAYWREQLAGLPNLELPVDHARQPGAHARGERESLELSPALLSGLRTLARTQQVTLFMTLLAAFEVLLARSTGATDLVVGTPVANRTRAGLERLVGLFANSLVLRTDLAGDPTFLELLERVRRTSLEAQDHQDVPFEAILDALQPERRLDRSPLFQVLFNYVDFVDPRRQLHKDLVMESSVARAGTLYDLTLYVFVAADSLRLEFEYDAGLFEAASVRRLLARLELLLAEVVDDADRRLSELPLLPPAERALLAAFGAGPPADAAETLSLPRLVEQTAARRPDAPAVRFRGSELTYAALCARARGIAAALAARGLGRGSLVALCLPRSEQLVPALLGILRSGAAYLPLDPAWPAARLAFMLEDSRAEAVLCTRAVRDTLPASAPRVLLLEELLHDASSARGTSPGTGTSTGTGTGTSTGTGQPDEPPAHDLDQRAYVLYTSGTTGRPKGVEIGQRALLNFLASMLREPGLGPHDTLLSVTTLSFDIAALELYLPLLAGGTVVIAPGEVLNDGVALGRLLDDTTITVCQATPSTWRMLGLSGWSPRAGLTMLCGGEPLPADLAEALLAGGGALWNLYGPTETTVWSTLHRVAPGEQPVPIGRPIRATTVCVVDEQLRPVPLGAPGELLIGGAGVALGYLGRPELQAQRFVRAPHTGSDGLFYRTGDLARLRGDGRLLCLGRIDEQVKLRGHRIELGEIESVLREQPLVADAAVAVHVDPLGEQRLVGYVVPHAGQAAEAVPQRIREQLRGSLPDSMVPATIVLLEALPRTANGKLDRRALPAPTGDAPAADHVPPATPTEKLLAPLWAAVLGIRHPGRHDSFFEFGGHSLQATQLIVRVRSTTGVAVPLRRFFETPTLAALAAIVDASEQDRSSPPPQAVPRDGPLPLSFSQQGMWVLDQLDPGSAEYVMPGAIRLRGRLDRPALEAAFTELVHRHEVLRTSFPSVGGVPQQLIEPPGPVTIPCTDLSALPPEAREAEARRLALLDAQTPFDLSARPPLRIALLRLADLEHVLLFAQHHIISDGWSLGVVVRELSALYAAALGGRPADLAPPPFQYADFAAWQRRQFSGALADRMRDYWVGQLTGAPASLDLPLDRPRPPIMTVRGARFDFRLSESTTARVRAAARAHGTTVFITLLAAYQTLLHRITGSDDIVVGTSIAARTRQEFEALPGVFMNTLALRTRFDGAPDFSRVLERVKATAHDAYQHQELPFEAMVAALNPIRDPGRSRLFQVFFDSDIITLEGLALQGLTTERLDIDPGIAKFDFAFSVGEAGARLKVEVDYNTDLFDASTMQRLARQFEALLDGLLAEPERPVAEQPLLTPDERQTLLTTWNDAAVRAVDLSRLVHRQFAEQVARTPHAVAVRAGEALMTHAELEAASHRLAQRLRRAGVGPEVLVGVCCERSMDTLVSVLGIWKAGGAYLPLDPDHPVERLRLLLHDARPAVLITRQAVASRLPASLAPSILCLDSEADALLQERAEAPDDVSRPEHLAYVIYTSGSTGEPKGVMIEHRALVNHIAWVRELFGLTSADRLLLRTPLTFDASLWEIVHPLVAGAQLVIAPQGVHEDADELLELAARHGITVLQTVPSLLRVWVDEPRLAGCRTLRHLICAGEALPAGLVARFQRRCRAEGLDVRLHNLYGPSEACIDSTSYTCAPAAGAPREETTIPVGRPASNVRVHVLDERLQPLPIGCVGEIVIGGAGLARGYLQRPEATAAAFVPDPFRPGSGERLYRTGDLGRFLPDGNLAFVGRRDSQVKLNGQRIELGEVEVGLERHPDVHQAVVVVHSGTTGGKRLVAYVVPRDGLPPERQLSAAALRRFLRDRLPSAMLPATWMFLDALPLNASQKVDRKALPPPDDDRPALQTRYVAPRSADERALAQIWQPLLGLARVGVHDDFFELGGNSLLAAQLASRVRSQLGVALPLRRLFEAPTIALLAANLRAVQQPGSASAGLASCTAAVEAPPLRPAPRDEPLPLSFAQQRLWFLDRLDPGSPLYHQAGALRLHGALDVPSLQRSLSELRRRHEALRTTFSDRDGVPLQHIGADCELPLPVEDWRADSASSQRAGASGTPAEREARVQERVRQLVREPFDLATGPLLRCTLLRLHDDEHVFVFVLHHIITDGWSSGLLLGELTALYAAARRGQPSPLPEPALQYADFAVWQRSWLTGEALAAQLAHWRAALDGAPAALDLPTDHPRPAVQSRHGARLRLPLPARLSADLRRLAHALDSTLFVTLLAAFDVLLHRLTGAEDLVVGTAVACRNRLELEGIVGFFVNTLPLRADLSGNPAFGQLVGRVRESVLAASAHQDLPFEQLVDALHTSRDLARTPLFQVAFGVDELPDPPLVLDGLQLQPLEVDPGTTKLDLNVTILAADETLVGELEYSTDLFERSTIERLWTHFTTLLTAVVADPETRIAQLPLLSEAQRQALLAASCGARVELPADACVPQRFARQVQRCPQALALIEHGRRTTYGELGARVGRLAGLLRARGVGPEVLVALAMPRSSDYLASVLALWAAGGAALPLDVTQPALRQRQLLEDAGVRLVLTAAGSGADLADEAWELLDVSAADDAAAPGVGSHAQALAATPLHGDNTATAAAAPHVPHERLAYVLFTSGSTGRPKGVEVTHGALASEFAWYVRELDVRPDDRFIARIPTHFDAGFLEWIPPLVSGASLVLVPHEQSADPRAIVDLIAEHEVTVIHNPPPMLEGLLGEARLSQCTHVRHSISGGERLTAGTLARLFARLPSVQRATFLYGPTEACIDVTACTWTREEFEAGALGSGAAAGAPAAEALGDPSRALPIGTPHDNTSITLVDEHGQLVPIGVAGEILVGGSSLARGYRHRAEETAAAFVADPFGEPGARVYRTGDLARWRSDGRLEFLGRRDDQLKLAGQRIEPGEVEHVMLAHPGVREVHVAARADGGGLIAWVAGAADAQALRAWLAERLPAVMVPGQIVLLDALPRLPTSKIDRQALPRPVERPELATPFSPARSGLEQQLVELFAGLLGLERVGVHDDFFALGGNSLLAIRLVSRIEARLHVALPVRDVFERPTPAGMAVALASLQSGGSLAALRAARHIDLHAEAVLPADIVPERAPAPTEAPRALLLTGATGFLGAHLAAELLTRTDGEVHCLVRAADEADALQRLHAALARYELLGELRAAGRLTRLRVLPGDLAAPRLGLDAGRFDALARSLDAIVHSGAAVDFLRPYAALKPSNVGGTCELLRLACRTRVKTFHHVSTIGVLPLLHALRLGRAAPVHENDPLPAPDGLQEGYEQSKWVAEALVREAGARGLPVAIHRPGRVAGSSRTGAANADDLSSRVLLACLRLGAAPDVQGSMDLTPVDYVAGAIAHLALHRPAEGRTYHLVNPRRVSVRSVFAWARAGGQPLRALAFPDWYAELVERLGAAPDDPLYPLLALLAPAPGEPAQESRFVPDVLIPELDCRNVQLGLRGSGVACPVVDAGLVRRWVDGLLAGGGGEIARV